MIARIFKTIVILCTLFGLETKSFAADFAPVLPGRVWSFPRDHGAHPEFKTEWWYFTGHLRAEDGKQFGFQWTVFRSALPPSKNTAILKPSAWRASQVYLGHLALSDLGEKKFYYTDTAARGALDLARASEAGFQVQLPGFMGESLDGNWRLQARGAELALSLAMRPSDEPLLHGQNGYSPKSPEPGRASYYYSIPAIPLNGEIRLQEKTYQVTGEAWMDHEFGSDQLSEGQSGWDWMGLPLGGKAALMLYRLRDRNDPKHDYLAGTFVDADGKAHPLSASDIQLKALDFWTSPRSGGKYPVTWQVTLPTQRLEIRVAAAFPEQELDTKNSTQVIYWEGSVTVRGQIEGRRIDSMGYLEMTGYAGDFDKKL